MPKDTASRTCTNSASWPSDGVTAFVWIAPGCHRIGWQEAVAYAYNALQERHEPCGVAHAGGEHRCNA